MHGCKNGYVEEVKIILSYKASLFLKDNEGASAQDLVCHAVDYAAAHDSDCDCYVRLQAGGGEWKRPASALYWTV